MSPTSFILMMLALPLAARGQGQREHHQDEGSRRHRAPRPAALPRRPADEAARKGVDDARRPVLVAAEQKAEYDVKISMQYVEIYNEKLKDLLNPSDAVLSLIHI